MRSTARSVATGQQQIASSVTGGQQRIATGELSLQRQLSAVASLQRQRSAALLSQWKQQERAALQAAAGVRPFRDVLQNLSTSVATLQGPLGGIAGRISSLSSLSGQLTSSVAGTTTAMGALGLALGGVAVGLGSIVAAGVGLFKLAQSTAAFGGRLKDLSDQTGIGVEALSTLKVAAEVSGGSIDSVNTALARYLRSVSDANHGNDTLAKKFAQVGFTANDLKTAYRSSDDAIRLLVERIGSLSSDQDRLNALQKVGVRNGTELNAVIRAMDGNFAEFQKRTREMGLVISPQQAEEADKFDDSLRLLTLQIKGLAYSIGREYLPEISGAISDLSRALASNKSSWSSWGEFIRIEIRGIRIAAAGLAAYLAAGSGPQGIAAGILASITKSRALHGAETVPGGVIERADIYRARSKELGDEITRGGRGGGRVARRAAPDVGAQLMKDLANQLANLSAKTEVQRTAVKLLDDQYSKLNPTLRNQILTVARQIDIEQKRQNLQAEIERAYKNVDEQIQRLVAGEQSHLAVAQQLLDNWERQGAVIPQLTSWWFQFNSTIADSKQPLRDLTDALLPQVEIVQKLSDELRSYVDILKDAEEENRILAKAIDRAMGGEAPPSGRQLEDKLAANKALERLHEQMRNLAADLTGLLDRALYDGISGGAKRGLQSLTLGLLDMIQQVILGRLKSALADALSGAATGGGWWKRLFGIVTGAAVGSMSGGAGGGGGIGGGARGGNYASGGFVQPGEWALTGERGPELIYGGRHGMSVFSNERSFGDKNIVNNINIHVPVKSSGSYSSPRSRRELAESISQGLQGALV